MNILVTGARGFIGKNLIVALKAIRDGKDRTHPELDIREIYEYDADSTPEQLSTFCRAADFVFHLAGVIAPRQQRNICTEIPIRWMHFSLP